MKLDGLDLAPYHSNMVPSRVGITALLFLAYATGCYDDSGSSQSVPTACDTDCDPETHTVYNCACDLDQNGFYCDNLSVAVGGLLESSICTTRCVPNSANADLECSNHCRDVDAEFPTPHFDYEATPIACALYPDSGSCGGWNPGTYVAFSSGVYHVDAAWLAALVENPDPLWTCDDAYLDGQSAGGFVVQQASAGELLYVLGLRNGDVPQSVNGFGVSTWKQVLIAAGRLYFSGVVNYTVIVTRSGSNLTFYYELV